MGCHRGAGRPEPPVPSDRVPSGRGSDATEGGQQLHTVVVEVLGGAGGKRGHVELPLLLGNGPPINLTLHHVPVGVLVRARAGARPSFRIRTHQEGCRGEWSGLIPGMAGPGVPILDASGRAVAALTIGTTADRLTDARRAVIAEMLRHGSALISNGLNSLDPSLAPRGCCDGRRLSRSNEAGAELPTKPDGPLMPCAQGAVSRPSTRRRRAGYGP